MQGRLLTRARMHSVTLSLPDASSLRLAAGVSLVLGRETVSAWMDASAAANVSRSHCQLTLRQEEPPEVLVQTLSKLNPTFLLRNPSAPSPDKGATAVQDTEVELLQPGCSSVLHLLDRFSLVAQDPDQNAILIAPCEPPSEEEDSPGSPEAGSQPGGPASGAGAAAAVPAATSAAAVGQQPPGGIMLVLVGPPGAGKSHLSKALLEHAPDAWVHVNQDTIAGGKPGNKKKCLAVATAALSTGRSVILDRCNTDITQRQAFQDLAKRMRCPLYAVVLSLPLKLCIQRATARTDHPSGVQGPRAAGLVTMFHRSLAAGGGPQSSEGFKGIMTCTTTQQVDVALAAWKLHRRQTDHGGSQGSGQSPSAGWIGADSEPGQASWQHWVQHSTTVAATRGTLASFFKRAAPSSAPAQPQPGDSTSGTRSTPQQGPSGESSKRVKLSVPANQAASAVATGSAGDTPPPPAAAAAAAASPQLEQVRDQAASVALQSRDQTLAAPPAQPRNAFQLLMAGSKSLQHQGPSAQSRAPASSAGSHDDRFKHWRQSLLYHMAMDPTKIDRALHPECYVDDQVIRINDLYPKGIHHCLVLPRVSGLDTVEDLSPAHLPLLAHMRQVAMQWVHEVHAEGSTQTSQCHPPACRTFRLGFHALPSMRQLHLHVISQDLLGTNMKKKQHFNSFASTFFLPLDLVEQQLRGGGKVDVSHAAAAVKANIVCHRCGHTGHSRQFGMPQVLEHLKTCTGADFAADAVTVH